MIKTRYLKVKASILLVALLALSTASADNVTNKRQLKIGVIAPLSGAVATWGRSVQSAIELANSESDYPAELIFEDEEACSSTKALSAFHSLTNQRNIDIIVASCLAGARVIAPMAKAKQLPMFISGRSSHEFQSAHPNAASWLSLLNYEGQYIAELIKERGWKRGAALVASDYFGQQFVLGISDAINAMQLPFDLKLREYNLDSQPVGADLLATLRDKPEVVILMTSESTAAFVVKQLTALRYHGAIVLQSSMLQTYDKGSRRPFSGAFMLRFDINQQLFASARERIAAKVGPDVADDFVFSYDGFKTLLKEAHICREEGALPINECLPAGMRNEEWRDGASGRFRFMKDGSTERPMRLKVITESGYED
jgi:ABC-type branched-subunit amino acid transport system substrate-binding protein